MPFSAGVRINTPDFKPILSSEKVKLQESGGVMAKNRETIKVRFLCDATKQTVSKAIYITGNLPELGPWKPNTIPMYDDGTHGDLKANDQVWTLELDVIKGSEVQYKYTNSGEPGIWSPSQEFPSSNRSFTVEGQNLIIRSDTFGIFE
jgi:hypothetical protein